MKTERKALPLEKKIHCDLEE